MTNDPVYDRIIEELLRRSEVGQRKYGVTVAAAPLSRAQWLQHLKEEQLDAAVYTQKLIDLEEASVEAAPDQSSAWGTKTRWRIARRLLRWVIRIAPDGSASCALEDTLNDWAARWHPERQGDSIFPQFRVDVPAPQPKR